MLPFSLTNWKIWLSSKMNDPLAGVSLPGVSIRVAGFGPELLVCLSKDVGLKGQEANLPHPTGTGTALSGQRSGPVWN